MEGMKTMMSSARQDWGTPQWLFDRVNEIMHFELDVCASNSNAKCRRYFTLADDGLSKDWDGIWWCNPPYGRGEIIKWTWGPVFACYPGCMLLPARTDTKWFQHVWDFATELCFIRGRLKFDDGKDSAPFPSVLAFFHNGRFDLQLDLSSLSDIGRIITL